MSSSYPDTISVVAATGTHLDPTELSGIDKLGLTHQSILSNFPIHGNIIPYLRSNLSVTDGACPESYASTVHGPDGAEKDVVCPYKRCTSVITVCDRDTVPISHESSLIGEITNVFDTAGDDPATRYLAGNTATQNWIERKHLTFATSELPIIGSIMHPALEQESAAYRQEPHSRVDASFSGHVKSVHTIIPPKVTVPSDLQCSDVISKFSQVAFSLEIARDDTERAEKFRQATGLSHGHHRAFVASPNSIAVDSYQLTGSRRRRFELNNNGDFGAVLGTGRLRFDPNSSTLHDPRDQWAHQTMRHMYGGSEGLEVTCLSTIMAEGAVSSTQEPELGSPPLSDFSSGHHPSSPHLPSLSLSIPYSTHFLSVLPNFRDEPMPIAGPNQYGGTYSHHGYASGSGRSQHPEDMRTGQHQGGWDDSSFPQTGSERSEQPGATRTGGFSESSLTHRHGAEASETGQAESSQSSNQPAPRAAGGERKKKPVPTAWIRKRPKK
ncbi:hypothetical protein IAU59_001050 [Kwoniella sp. CBS 9459]